MNLTTTKTNIVVVVIVVIIIKAFINLVIIIIELLNFFNLAVWVMFYNYFKFAIVLFILTKGVFFVHFLLKYLKFISLGTDL